MTARARKRREKECGDKLAYASLEDANAAGHRPHSVRRGEGLMRGYRCRWCKLYHYGHAR